MADVTYNTAAFPSLISTLEQLYHRSHSTASQTAPSACRRPIVLLAYKERHPSEREFFARVREAIGMDFVRVGSEDGAGGAPVEIYVLDITPS